jgi:hypothetical protein
MTANEPKADFVVSLCPAVQFGEAPISPVLGKNPIEGSRRRDRRRIFR